MNDVLFVPISCCTASEIEEAVLSCSDAFHDTDGTVKTWLRRHQEVLWGGPYFTAVNFIFDKDGGAGWVGWVPYLEGSHEWQSTVYLAPRIRGTGLFPVAQCQIFHLADKLQARFRDTPSGVTFVTSISVENGRSIAAHKAYTREWKSAWERVWENKSNGERDAWVLQWDEPFPAHPCFLP